MRQCITETGEGEGQTEFLTCLSILDVICIYIYIYIISFMVILYIHTYMHAYTHCCSGVLWLCLADKLNISQAAGPGCSWARRRSSRALYSILGRLLPPISALLLRHRAWAARRRRFAPLPRRRKWRLRPPAQPAPKIPAAAAAASPSCSDRCCRRSSICETVPCRSEGAASPKINGIR